MNENIEKLKEGIPKEQQWRIDQAYRWAIIDVMNLINEHRKEVDTKTSLNYAEFFAKVQRLNDLFEKGRDKVRESKSVDQLINELNKD